MTGQISAQAMKQAIRQRIIADRAALTQGGRARLSREITARLLRLAAYREAHTVLGYMSFGAEFESGSWVRQVLGDGKVLLLPKVNTETRELDLYRVTDVDTQLAPGAFGISEPLPQSCAAARLEDADFVLLPGVAFGRDGARLGYGGGFYDKLLMKQLAIRLGEQTTLAKSVVMAGLQPKGTIKKAPALVAAAYALQVIEGIPQEANDCKVEWLVTEAEIIQCAKQQHSL